MKLLLTVLGTLSTTLGAIAFLPVAISAFQAIRARDWPTAPGIVEAAEVERWTEITFDPDPYQFDQTGAELHVEPSVRYSYEVDGRTYASERISFDVPEFVYAKFVEELDPGDPVVVHHHPLDPARAVLHRGLHWGNWVIVLIASFLLAAGFLLLRASARERSPSAVESM